MSTVLLDEIANFEHWLSTYIQGKHVILPYNEPIFTYKNENIFSMA